MLLVLLLVLLVPVLVLQALLMLLILLAVLMLLILLALMLVLLLVPLVVTLPDVLVLVGLILVLLVQTAMVLLVLQTMSRFSRGVSTWKPYLTSPTACCVSPARYVSSAELNHVEKSVIAGVFLTCLRFISHFVFVCLPIS